MVQKYVMIISFSFPPTDDTPYVTGPLIRAVNSVLQEEFFNEIQRELDDVNSFFRARQAALSHLLHELEGEVGTPVLLYLGFRYAMQAGPLADRPPGRSDPWQIEPLADRPPGRSATYVLKELVVL